ncbi:MAG: NHL repeat-containing protein, partial [Nitrospinota bacterium]|nr:NHL repeat-containing protein [Nitrospinota bacterium]
MPHPPTGLNNLPLEWKNSFRHPQPGEEIELSPPSGFALTPQGHLIVADDFNHRIQMYDSKQNVKTCFGSKGKENGQFMYPRGMDVDSEGNLFVTDSWNHRVQKFSPEGKHLLSFGEHGEEKGQLNEPYDVLVLGPNEIIVVERYNHRIQFFSADGISQGWIGNRGTLLEDHLAQIYETHPHVFPRPVFEFPTSITKDSYGNFFIADSGNHRIIKFDSQWNIVQTLGVKGDEAGQFQYPLCVSCSPNGLLYVADLNNNRVQVFTSQGQFLTTMNRSSEGETLQTPCLTLVDPEGKLYIGLTFNPVVSVFQTPGQPLDFFYNSLSKNQPEDFLASYYQGSFCEEAGSKDLARGAYARGIDVLTTKNDNHSLHASSGFEESIHLPINYCRTVTTDPLPQDTVPRLLKCLDFYDSRLEAICRILLDRKKSWDEQAAVYFRELIREESLILDQKEDPLAFNKELYQAEKADKALFREMRSLFYVYRRLCEQKAEYMLALLQGGLSASAAQQCVASALSRYQAVCDHINTLLDSKENNEVEMIRALSDMENSEDQWANFHSNSMFNIRIMDSLKHFLFELRTLFKTIKGTTLKSDEPWVEDYLTDLFIKTPASSLIPTILLRIQEDWDLLPFLETQYKEILDTWLVKAGQ